MVEEEEEDSLQQIDFVSLCTFDRSASAWEGMEAATSVPFAERALMTDVVQKVRRRHLFALLSLPLVQCRVHRMHLFHITDETLYMLT